MASRSIRWQMTLRDHEILAALDLCPMECRDLLAISETFSQPFGSLDRIRRTLNRLAAARQVRSWRYATTGEGGGAAPLYYKLTLDGYRTLHQDDDALPPTKRYLHEVSPGRHRHQRNLTNYIVKTHIAAHRRGLQILDSYPENTYRIDTPSGLLFPDRRFTLSVPSVGRFTYCVELDNSTESIWSRSSADSIEMKLRRYVANLAATNDRYRVQIVVAGAPSRFAHILDAAARLSPSADFSPFYIVQLDQYLAADDPFLEPIFASPSNPHIALLRAQAEPLSRLSPLRHSAGVARQLALC